jgi:hypothetical protein
MPGRANATHCVHGHEYTNENTYYYKARDGRVRRTCRTCQREREEKQRKKRMASRRYYEYPSYE